MRLWLTVVDPRRAHPVDVVVDGVRGLPLGAVRSGLLAFTDRADGPLRCDGQELTDAAPLGSPPLVRGAILTVGTGAPVAARGLLELRVTGGPDAGAIRRLAPGEYSLGRSREADVQVADPDVSRLHCLLHVGDDIVTVHDLDSTNGTSVDGAPVNHEGHPFVPGQVLTVGETRLELATPVDSPVACRPTADGHVELNRPPRLRRDHETAVVDWPREPPSHEPTRLPLVALVLPAVAGLALVAVTRSPTYLFFVLLSPLMLLGTFLNDRIGGRRRERAARRAYDDAVREAEQRIADAVDAETDRLCADHPDAAELMLTVREPRPRLWERRRTDADALALRCGLATLPASVEVRTGADSTPGPRPTLDAAPVAVPLRDIGVLGVAGRRPQALALTRFLVAQLAGWHSPRHLALVLLVGAEAHAPDWEWARWLPQLDAGGASPLSVGLAAPQVSARLAELVTSLEARQAEAAATRGQRFRPMVVLLDGAGALRRRPGVVRVLDEGPAVGIHLLCLDDEVVALPAECAATVELVGDTASHATVTVTGRPPVTGVVVDGVSERWAARFARALAPVRDATPEDAVADLPADARLIDLLPLDATDAVALAGSWRRGDASTRMVLGVGAAGAPVVVDLRADGPHMLLAGTTGSGKSELLQTLVAGLAVGNRPEDMSFVLVDYKGGAAFKDCARLPHTAGVVTDLDGRLTERALTSLGAELRRRERVLQAAGCADIDAYAARTPGAGTADVRLPRLVLVVDEFATLAEELPDFVGGLVGIAQRGRSLGVHLVLATQRPAGVVRADVRANTALRVALRVTDPADSCDVVDVADAAAISRSTPGRALLRLGEGPVISFQSARVGGRAPRETSAGPSLQVVNWVAAGDPVPEPGGADADGPSDLARLADAAIAAATTLGASAPASPWLSPLPDRIGLDEVPAVDDAWSVPLGVRDVPAEQRRAPFALDLRAGGHLLVVGGPRSGRTTVLRTLAGAVGARFAPADVHLFALDGGSGGLGHLASLPHCGAVVGRDEPTRADRLLTRLRHEVDRRRQVLAAAGHASVTEHRAATLPEERLPWLVVLVDGWEGVQAALETVDHGRPLDTLLRIVREGGAAGLRVVMTGERGLLTSRPGSLVSDRLLLRLPERSDYALAGIPARVVPRDLAPGRGLLSTDATEVQVALHDDADGDGPTKARADMPAHQRPLRVDPLPDRVAADSLRRIARPRPGELWTLLGVGGDELAPVGVDLDVDGPAFVVAGPPRSGRSTTLATMTRWLDEAGVPIVLVAPGRSPLRQLVAQPGVLGCVSTHDDVELERLVEKAGDGPLAVIVDDAETVHDTVLERPLLDLLRGHDGRRLAMVLAGSSTDMAACFRGLTVEARRSRCGLLLGPAGPLDGELLGVRLPRTDQSGPGRGHLVVRGRVTPLQVAVDDEAGTPTRNLHPSGGNRSGTGPRPVEPAGPRGGGRLPPGRPGGVSGAPPACWPQRAGFGGE